MRRYSNNSKNQNRPTLRRSQTVTTFGVGAIIDLPDSSVMTCAIDKWDTKGFVTLSDPRLEKKLGVGYFLMPGDIDSSADGIRTVRFPRWMRCKNCNRLQSLDSWRTQAAEMRHEADFLEKPRCSICGIPLTPSRFVVACRKGHLDDFPFLEWAHGGEQICSNPKLKYFDSRGASLSNIIIKCETCNKQKSMAGSFSKDVLSKVAVCRGHHPWNMSHESCGEDLTTLQRGGTNVHFPIIKSSILIPPHKADSLKDKIRNTHTWQIYETSNNAVGLEVIIPSIANELGLEAKAVEQTINEMSGGVEIIQDEKTEEDYRFEEYQAFMGNFDKDKGNDRDFLINVRDNSGYGLPLLNKIVLVKKLREIRVQVGFSRIRPPQNQDETGNQIPENERIEQTPVTFNKKLKWLPGYEVRGEGIMLNIDPDKLALWSQKPGVIERVNKLILRANRTQDISGIVDKLTPEFVLLHTLAHIMIRQLSFECGYSSSSLRERIYCSSDQKNRKMAGILLYTAEGDSDGTLGGLVKQGESDYLGLTLEKALKEAQWCSSDPLCIESEGQGYQSLNLGACHSCAMLPETCCELFNRYLDRGLLIGTPESQDLGFFRNWLDDLE